MTSKPLNRGEAVAGGELSLEQAHLMMDALRGHNSTRVMEAKIRYLKFAEAITAAVKAGEVSMKESERKLIVKRREMF
jgi:hydroxymethylglutaryl-CoA reductase